MIAGRAIRLDMLERLEDVLEKSVIEGTTAEAMMPKLVSLLGCGNDELREILGALGWHAADLAPRQHENRDLVTLGDVAEEDLGAALMRLGAERLAAGGDDVALLVPEYVTLPRGVLAMKGEVRWSRDLP